MSMGQYYSMVLAEGQVWHSDAVGFGDGCVGRESVWWLCQELVERELGRGRRGVFTKGEPT
jgi:hypothetical protein